jgi:zinc protease
MRRSAVLIISLAGLAAAQAPQAPQSLAGVVKLNRVPVSKDVLRVKLPRPVDRQLSNGLRLMVVESHRVPMIWLQIRIEAGDMRNPADLPGLSDATAALLRLGTETRNSKEIADTLADLGAQLNLNASSDYATISLSSLTENFDAALAVLADVLLKPSFPEDEFDKWKTRTRAGLEQMKTNPSSLANDLLYAKLYGSDIRQYTHPTAASLDKITRDDVIRFYKTYYVPSGELAGIAGDITPADAVARLNRALGAWKGGPAKAMSLPLAAPLSEKKIYLIPRQNSVQTLLMVANRAIDRNSPDYIAVQVMNRVLGNGPSSRLFRIVREEKGFTYGIGSSFTASRIHNHFTTNTSVRTEVTEQALEEILKQFADIRERAVPADELADAKSAIIGSFALSLESPLQVLSRWMEQREYGLPDDYWDTYAQKVSAVTPDEVSRVAKKYVPFENAQIIAVGEPGKIADVLKKFGNVETVSIDSK